MANGMLGAMGRGDNSVIRVKAVTAGDLTIHYVAMPFISPAWTVQGDNLYVAFYPQVVVAAAQRSAAGRPGLGDNRDFAVLRKALGGQLAIAIQFANLPEAAPDGYSLLLVVERLALGIADMFGIDAPAMVVPTLPQLQSVLSPAASVAWTDESGWHMSGLSPFPGSALVAANTSGMLMGQTLMTTGVMLPAIATGLPALGAARRNAKKMQSSTYARTLAQAALVHASHHKDVLPPDIVTLVEDQVIDPEILISPFSDAQVPEGFGQLSRDQKAQWIEQNSSYVFEAAGRRAEVKSQDVLFYGKPGDHEKGIPVAYSDTHTEWLDEDEATSLIERLERGQ